MIENERRSKQQIQGRLLEVEKRLSQIEQALSRERERPFFFRRPNLCLLLNVEKRIQTALYQELKWVLYE